MLISSTKFTARDPEDIQNLVNTILQSKGLSGNSYLIDDYEKALQKFFKVNHAMPYHLELLQSTQLFMH